MTVYAYLRVSQKGQTTENQKLKISSVEFIHVDEWVTEHAVSGSIRALDRPQFSALIEKAKAGDTIISVSLDRFGRDTEDVLHTIRKFLEKGVHLRLLDLEVVDLTSDTGKILVTLLSLVAEMERNKCITRSAQGVARARDEGKVFGRYLTITPPTLNLMRNERLAGKTYREIADIFNVNKDTICQTLKTWGEMLEHYEETWNKQQQQKLTKTMKGNKDGK